LIKRTILVFQINICTSFSFTRSPPALVKATLVPVPIFAFACIYPLVIPSYLLSKPYRSLQDMFSFRRKGNKKQDDSPQSYASPSLPLLDPQGIPWPENLVDVASIRQTPPPEHAQQGAAKTSFQGPDRAPIPFHKPFRGTLGKPADGKTISALYMSASPSSFDHRRLTTASASSRQANHRRTRIPPTFNLMVRTFDNRGAFF
jgi:hypothetical protein